MAVVDAGPHFEGPVVTPVRGGDRAPSRTPRLPIETPTPAGPSAQASVVVTPGNGPYVAAVAASPEHVSPFEDAPAEAPPALVPQPLCRGCEAARLQRRGRRPAHACGAGTAAVGLAGGAAAGAAVGASEAAPTPAAKRRKVGGHVSDVHSEDETPEKVEARVRVHPAATGVAAEKAAAKQRAKEELAQQKQLEKVSRAKIKSIGLSLKASLEICKVGSKRLGFEWTVPPGIVHASEVDVHTFRAMLDCCCNKLQPAGWDPSTAAVVGDLNGADAGRIFGVQKIRGGSMYAKFVISSIAVTYRPQQEQLSLAYATIETMF
mmetsp:Transcript_122288/g.391235  ORF Transcript_122288/g.391235 Transcript_122288/m.391235 type:complete len:320 (+) Transcript_122288:61-1020(+)|eukprot:CAMPEP_0203841188 /NCGR_PEP_ID=MMETSP0359-20131031/1230_1 /ASSEMBLY_ACC=CAM_ASM_000338 /TAXON_ID=268821 /ORGANISM="Scrippsiella Hangoei, Strain SHTV-5" /LENGTH=319 /DNA_ID=CAMNT_0050755539 /DNA_START=42 /DNA_END=1001 /DNA_ORIENTATION=-